MKDKKINISVTNLNVESYSEPHCLEIFNRIINEFTNLSRGDRVYIKPNLAFPKYTPGVCTNKFVIESICKLLHDMNIHITICEGDGGIAAFSANEAFEGNNLLDLATRYGVNFVSLSQQPGKSVTQIIANKEIIFKLPITLIDREFDVFINIPVLKAHLYTRLSLSMKNLWGCIPDPFRIHYHRILHHGIVALWKSIRPDLSIIDGTIALDGNGPINGVPVPMNVILAGSKDATIDRVGAKIMGIPFESVKHLNLAEQEGLIQSWQEIELSQPINNFCRHTFKIKRGLTDWGGILISKSPVLQKLVYHSLATQIICKILFRVRKNNIQNTLRRFGDPEWGKDCGPSEFCRLLGTSQ